MLLILEFRKHNFSPNQKNIATTKINIQNLSFNEPIYLTLKRLISLLT